MNLDEIIKNLKVLLFYLIIFTSGFLLGNWCKNVEYDNKIWQLETEIIDLKEQVHRTEVYKK